MIKMCSQFLITRGRPRLFALWCLFWKIRTQKLQKLAAKAINKYVSEWTAWRALPRIGLISPIKHYHIKTVRLVWSFAKVMLNGQLTIGHAWSIRMKEKLIDFNQLQRNIIGIEKDSYYIHRRYIVHHFYFGAWPFQVSIRCAV